MDTKRNATFSTTVLFGAICRLLNLEPSDVVVQAGLPERLATGHGNLINEEEFFLLWNTIVWLGQRPDFAAYVGRGLANGANSLVFFALSCAPDLQTGLERFARFKHVFGPLGMSVRNHDHDMHVRLVPLRPEGIIPNSVAGPILTFLHEKAQSCTARTLVPQAVHMPMPQDERIMLSDVFGVTPQEGEPLLVYAMADARCRLVSENAVLWASLEADLEALITAANTSTSIADRVRACLIEAISDGDPSIAFVCERMLKSRSSLLRDLQADGTSFNHLLIETRKSLALRYLRNSNMPIKQVASLLAYRDSNAFHRAFKNWTGLTPSAARGADC